MHEVGLVILDFEMPELGGIEAAERIRKFESIKKSKPVPILGLTGQDSEEVATKGRRAGMNTVLSKPIKKQDLSNILITFLSSFGRV